jgi:hypothetical protein
MDCGLAGDRGANLHTERAGQVPASLGGRVRPLPREQDPIPTSGLYAFMLVIDGEIIAQRRIEIYQREGAP